MTKKTVAKCSALTRYSAAFACAVAVLTCFGLDACVSGPEFRRPEADAPAQWSDWHGGAASLALPKSEEGEAAFAGARWAVFDDPELVRLLDRAKAVNFDVMIALLHLAQARVQETTVSAQRGIQVNGTVDVSRRRDSEYGANTRIVDVIGGANTAPVLQALGEPYSLYRPGFDASWELDLWGRIGRSEEAANASTQEQAASLRQTQLSVVADAARDYFTLRSAQRRLQYVQRELSATDDEVRLLKAQQAGGLIDESAVIRVEQQRADLLSLIPSLQSEEARAINQMTQLLAAKPGSLDAELVLPALPAVDTVLPDLHAGIPSEFARHRPDIAAAEARLHSATASIGVATADLYPRVTLGAAFGLESVGSSHLDSWGARHWSVGPSLSLPLFDHGRRTSTITLRRLEEQEVAIAYQQTVLKAWHEVDDAVTGYRANVQQCAQLLEKTTRSERDSFLAAVRAHQGSTSEVPDLEAQIAHLKVQQDLAVGEAQRNIALVALFKALGDDGLVHRDSESIVEIGRHADISR